MTRTSRREMLSVGAAGAISLAVADSSWSEEPRPLADQEGPRVTPFLAFFGTAEKAMERYVGLIENSRIVFVEHFGPGDVGEAGTVKTAEFSLNGQRVRCNDIPGKHSWTFTPAVSLYVEHANEETLAKYFEELSKGGKVLMPLDKYPFSEKFAWVEDEFGVSWQLSIAST